MASLRESQKYTVYDNRIGFPIAVCETAAECARIMGVKRGTFYHSINNKRGNRWKVIKEGKCKELFEEKEIVAYSIGENLKKARKKNGFKQNELSAKTGIPVISLSRYENDKVTPTIWNLITIADFYGISIDELIGRKI